MGIVHLQDSEGILDFLPGERLKFITVTISDNPVPELEKIFRVELYDTVGGGESFEFNFKKKLRPAYMLMLYSLCSRRLFLAAYFP